MQLNNKAIKALLLVLIFFSNTDTHHASSCSSTGIECGRDNLFLYPNPGSELVF